MRPVSHTLINSIRAPIDRVFALLTDPARIAQWLPGCDGVQSAGASRRAEEHTSELQSHSDLVCRLLPAKKKEKRKRKALQCNAPGHRDSGSYYDNKKTEE